MATMTIKNMPNDLYAKLKESAKEHDRSINGEAIYQLKRGLVGGRIEPERFLAEVKAMQDEMDLPPLTDEFLRKAKEEGRP